MRVPLQYPIALGLTCLAAACAHNESPVSERAASEPTSTAKNVPKPDSIRLVSPATFETLQPYLAANCRCHAVSRRALNPDDSPSSVPGGFDVTSYSAVMRGGSQGVAVNAGDPSGSLVIAYLKGIKKPQMPAKNPPLPDADIKVISDWISAGAPEK